jgi:hypothetical protein
MKTAAERFWVKVDVAEPDECWRWAAGLTSEGYGNFRVGDKMVVAHRWAYENEIGPIPAELELDHLCRTRSCVNTDHLEAVTQRENVMRGEGAPARNARKTHCKRGHEFTTENTYNNPSRERICRACNRAYEIRRTQRRRARKEAE